MADRRTRGKHAEDAARACLIRAGLREIAANANYRGGELDLVMRDGDSVVFVEVRYRRSSAFGGGMGAVDSGKRRQQVLAAQLFLAEHREYSHAPCRFDVVEASGNPDAPDLNWMKDAFRADEA